MPLIVAPEEWPVERLRAQSKDLRDGIEQLATVIGRAPRTPPNPWAVAAALEHLRRTTALADAVLATENPSPRLLGEAASVVSEVGSSFPFFLRASERPPPAFPSRPSSPPAPGTGSEGLAGPPATSGS